MKPDKFDQKFGKAWGRSGGTNALTLFPKLAQMPLPIQRHDDPFLPWSKAIIDATRDLLCAYIFDMASYLALGAAGAIALERAIAYANGSDETLTILHAPFVGSGFVAAAEAFNADAVTLVSENSYADADRIAQYNQAGVGVFLLEESGSLTGSIVNDWLPTGTNLKIWLVDSKIPYASSGDDFAERARAALQSWRYTP